MRAFMLIVTVAAVAACNRTPDPDAFGNFESTEVVVSAETGGQIREFIPVEGMTLARGAVAVVIDTTQLALERQQILAQRAATGSRGNATGPDGAGKSRVNRSAMRSTPEFCPIFHT